MNCQVKLTAISLITVRRQGQCCPIGAFCPSPAVRSCHTRLARRLLTRPASFAAIPVVTQRSPVRVRWAGRSVAVRGRLSLCLPRSAVNPLSPVAGCLTGLCSELSPASAVSSARRVGTPVAPLRVHRAGERAATWGLLVSLSSAAVNPVSPVHWSCAGSGSVVGPCSAGASAG